ELANVEVLVSTNQGTYGLQEAARKVGAGDPRVADRNVYETVGGRVRTTGPDEADAPGRMRHVGRSELRDLREQLQALREEIAELEQAEEPWTDQAAMRL